MPQLGDGTLKTETSRTQMEVGTSIRVRVLTTDFFKQSRVWVEVPGDSGQTWKKPIPYPATRQQAAECVTMSGQPLSALRPRTDSRFIVWNFATNRMEYLELAFKYAKRLEYLASQTDQYGVIAPDVPVLDPGWLEAHKRTPGYNIKIDTVKQAQYKDYVIDPLIHPDERRPLPDEILVAIKNERTSVYDEAVFEEMSLGEIKIALQGAAFQPGGPDFGEDAYDPTKPAATGADYPQGVGQGQNAGGQSW